MAERFRIERLPEFDNHRWVSFFYDKKSGLRAFVAVHNDNLGPGTGGTRMWPYQNEQQAIRDVLNLSRAMTYKCALAGVPYGGSKGVIIGNPIRDKNRALLEAYAKNINYLGGVTTGTDVGLNDSDLCVMRRCSKYILGSPNGKKLSTSCMAALGVFYSILGVFREIDANVDLSGRGFAIKGLGKTGMELARLLCQEDAHIIATEINKRKIDRAKKMFPKIRIVSPKVIHKQDVDVYCPCALGGDLNNITVRELRCRFVVGSANNQLASPRVGLLLHKRGIFYAPDYVANAGGLINVVDELEEGGYSAERVLAKVRDVEKTIRTIISRSRSENKPTSVITDQMAEGIFTRTHTSS